MRGGARRPHARRSLSTLSVRPREPNEADGPFSASCASCRRDGGPPVHVAAHVEGRRCAGGRGLSRARDQHAASAVGRRRRSRSPAAQRDGLDVGDRRLRARRGPLGARANRAPASRGEARGADARAVAMPGRPRRGRVEPRAPRAGADRPARARRSAVRRWRRARRGGGGRPQDGCPLRDRSRGLSRCRASRLAGGDALARPRAADRARRPAGRCCSSRRAARASRPRMPTGTG